MQKSLKKLNVYLGLCIVNLLGIVKSSGKLFHTWWVWRPYQNILIMDSFNIAAALSFPNLRSPFSLQWRWCHHSSLPVCTSPWSFVLDTGRGGTEAQESHQPLFFFPSHTRRKECSCVMLVWCRVKQCRWVCLVEGWMWVGEDWVTEGWRKVIALSHCCSIVFREWFFPHFFSVIFTTLMRLIEGELAREEVGKSNRGETKLLNKIQRDCKCPRPYHSIGIDMKKWLENVCP